MPPPPTSAPSGPPPPVAPPGQWVWAPATPGHPTEGRWVWMAFAPPPPGGRPNQTGRIGLFIAGYFGLGLVYWLFGIVCTVLGVSDDIDQGPGVVAAVAAVFGGALLGGAARARKTSLEPLGIMAAFGAGLYVAMAAGCLAVTAGLEGMGVFWAVVLVSLPYGLAVLLWQPHPILGVNVAIAVTAFVVAAPIGDDAVSVASGKAVLLAVVLAGLGVIVDLRTRSRAGTVLHVVGVVVAAIAAIIVAFEVGGLAAAGIVAGLATAQLFVALMMRRDLWAVSGWITLTLALVGALGAAPAEAAIGSVAGGVVAIPLGFAAFTLQSRGEDARRTVLAALPPVLAASFPP